MPDDELIALMLWFHYAYRWMAPLELPAHLVQIYNEIIDSGELL